MKKYFNLLLILLVMVLPLMGVDAKKTTTSTTVAGEKVNLYVFYSDSCSNCANLHSYIDETLSKDKTHNYMYELVDYEASNSFNATLMSTVSDYFDVPDDYRNKVPLIVIGEQYYVGFSVESSPSLIEAAIEKAYTERQTDIVAGLSNGTVTVPDKSLTEEDVSTDSSGVLIIGIIAIVIVLIIYGSSRTKESE